MLLAGRVTVVGELWGRRRVIPGLSPSPNPNTVQCSTLWSLVCVRQLWLTITNQGHNWFGDEWPSLGLTEEEFLIEYSKTLDKLAGTHKRFKNQQDSHVLQQFAKNSYPDQWRSFKGMDTVLRSSLKQRMLKAKSTASSRMTGKSYRFGPVL